MSNIIRDSRSHLGILKLQHFNGRIPVKLQFKRPFLFVEEKEHVYIPSATQINHHGSYVGPKQTTLLWETQTDLIEKATHLQSS